MIVLHTLYYAVARGIPGIVSFISIIVFTRLLSPRDYGDYVVVLAYVALIDAFLFQWLRLSFYRLVPAKDVNNERLFSTTFVSYAAIVLLTTTAGVIISYFFITPDVVNLVLAGTAIVAVGAWFEINQSMANVTFSPVRFGLQALSRSTIVLAVGTTLAYLGWGALGVLIGIVAGSFFTGAYSWFTDWRSVSLKEFDSELAVRMLRYGLPLTGSIAMVMVIRASDRVMLSWFWGSAPAGLYGASGDLIQNTLGLLMVVVNHAAYPLVLKANESNSEELLTGEWKDNLSLLLAVSLPALAFVWAAAPNISLVVLGAEFRDSATEFMPLFALAGVLAGLRVFHFDLAFQLKHKTSVQFRIMVAAVLANVLLNLLLIPAYSLWGAIIATITTLFLALVLSIAIGSKVMFSVWPWKSLAQVGASAIAVYACASMVKGAGLYALLQQTALSGIAAFGIFILLDFFQLRTTLLSWKSGKASVESN